MICADIWQVKYPTSTIVKKTSSRTAKINMSQRAVFDTLGGRLRIENRLDICFVADFLVVSIKPISHPLQPCRSSIGMGTFNCGIISLSIADAKSLPSEGQFDKL
jgi:hypothetical protein